MPQIYTKEKILETCEKEKINFIDLQFSDLLGKLKAVTIPTTKLAEAIDNNVWFDGSSIEGFARIFESDMYLKLDLNTFAILPWTKSNGSLTARFICDVYTPNGQPYESDPRYILKKQITRANAMGYTYYVGPELEFFIINKNNGVTDSAPTDTAGYFDQTSGAGSELRKEMSLALQGLNIDVEALHHEVAHGQHEIDFRYNEPLTAADNVITMKYALKTIAAKYNQHVTFMPKPFFGINGSGMHVHQSLFKDNMNAFYNTEDIYHLSAIAKKFIAGQLKHIKAMNAILNPIINSYKRLVAGYEAPVYITWGRTNRSALMRVPEVNPNKPNSTRAELRCPDPATNPYLAFAVMLAAGLDGIENENMIPKAIEENVYELTEEDMKKRNIETLPADLYSALKALSEDPIIKEVLGENTFNKYTHIKTKEWDEYRIAVTDWEKEKYLLEY